MKKKLDKIYFKVIHTASGREDYASVKTDVNEIPAAWSERFGTYVLTEEAYVCNDCPYMNYEGFEIKLSEEDGLIKAEMEAETKDTEDTLKFSTISDTVAVSIGLGRGAGRTMRILENGNLFYNGFELTKIK